MRGVGAVADGLWGSSLWGGTEGVALFVGGFLKGRFGSFLRQRKLMIPDARQCDLATLGINRNRQFYA